MKTLVLLASSSSYRLGAFQEAAGKLGIPVVHAEDVPPPMLDKTEASLAIDYRDHPRAVRRIERFASRRPIGAIIGLDDSGTQIAALASARLGLPYNDPESARAAGDKYLMRKKFAAAGVPSPHFRHYTLQDDPRVIAGETRYPAVLKPVNLAGSQGVMRLDTDQDLFACHERLKAILHANRCSEFLIEDFIPGREVALEGLLVEGELRVLALFDKPDPLDGPFFEETLYITPSRLPRETQAAVAQVAGAAARALGLRQGPVHAELRISPEGPVMVEIAARSIGGNCSQTLVFGVDESLEELILRQAFGLPFDTNRQQPASGVMMIPIPEPGMLKSVKGLEAARRTPAITEVTISAPRNQKLVPLPEGNSYLGFIFAHGETPDQVESALREAHSRLQFEIVPELPLLAAAGSLQI